MLIRLPDFAWLQAVVVQVSGLMAATVAILKDSAAFAKFRATVLPVEHRLAVALARAGGCMVQMAVEGLAGVSQGTSETFTCASNVISS